MHLDLRVPIGLMLATFGLILFADGVVRGVLVLGINVNLWWGLVMIACGSGTLAWTKTRVRGGSQSADEGRGRDQRRHRRSM